MTEYVYRVSWPNIVQGKGNVCSLGRLRAIQRQYPDGGYKVERAEVKWEDVTEEETKGTK